MHRQVQQPYKVKRPYEVDSHSRSTINAGRFARASPNFHARSYYERLRLGATPQETRDEGSPPATRTKKGFVFRGYPEIGRGHGDEPLACKSPTRSFLYKPCYVHCIHCWLKIWGSPLAFSTVATSFEINTRTNDD